MPHNARRHRPTSHQVIEVEEEGVRVHDRKSTLVDLALVHVGAVVDLSWLNGAAREVRAVFSLQRVA